MILDPREDQNGWRPIRHGNHRVEVLLVHVHLDSWHRRRDGGGGPHDVGGATEELVGPYLHWSGAMSGCCGSVVGSVAWSICEMTCVT